MYIWITYNWKPIYDSSSIDAPFFFYLINQVFEYIIKGKSNIKACTAIAGENVNENISQNVRRHAGSTNRSEFVGWFITWYPQTRQTDIVRTSERLCIDRIQSARLIVIFFFYIGWNMYQQKWREEINYIIYSNL